MLRMDIWDLTLQTLITVRVTPSRFLGAQKNELFSSAGFTLRENVNMEATDQAFSSISQLSNLHLVQGFKLLWCLSDSVLYYFIFYFLPCLARIKPHWASRPLTCDFVKAIDFQLRPAPSLKPQKAYRSDSIFCLMRILYRQFMIHHGNSSEQFHWTLAPESHLSIIVLISKEYVACQQTFNYIFQPLFHFVACYFECRRAPVYIAWKKLVVYII